MPDQAFDIQSPKVAPRIKRDAPEWNRYFRGPTLRVDAGACLPDRIEVTALVREFSEDTIRPRACRVNHEEVSVSLSPECIKRDLDIIFGFEGVIALHRFRQDFPRLAIETTNGNKEHVSAINETQLGPLAGRRACDGKNLGEIRQRLGRLPAGVIEYSIEARGLIDA